MSRVKALQPRERLSSTAAHGYQVGDFVSKSTDWRPYQVVDVSALSLEIERMTFHRAIVTRIAMKIRRDRWVPLDAASTIARPVDSAMQAPAQD